MLKITIEHLPDDGSGPARVLGVAEVRESGDLGCLTNGRLTAHEIRLYRASGAGRLPEPWKFSMVDRFDSRRRGVWDLLYLGLRACVGARNGESYRQTSFNFNEEPETESLRDMTAADTESSRAA